MKIGFLGAGKMAEGILQAVFAAGIDANEVVMAERNADRAKEMAKKYGVAVVADVKDAVRKAGFLFLAVRPQDLASVADVIKPLLSDRKLIVSIVAGKTLAKLRAAFGTKVRLVRVMPNLALRVGAGMCAICGAKNAKAADLKRVAAILGKAGRVVELQERHFDAVTALSGSGPAFVAYVEKAMIEGGVKLGLKRDVARELAEQTMFGTVRFLQTTNADLETFIAGVCTKGGTTAAGMDVMAPSDLNQVMAGTLAAAARRSAELAG